MKAVYEHVGGGRLIYDQIICQDNAVITTRIAQSDWTVSPSETKTKMYSTNAEAQKTFNNLCEKFEKRKYKCIYKEENDYDR